MVNLCNAYEKQEILPEMLELAKFAKHHIPQEHELDDPDFVDKRIWVSFLKNVYFTLLGANIIYLVHIKNKMTYYWLAHVHRRYHY